MQNRNRLSREAVASPFLEVFKTWLDKATADLIQCWWQSHSKQKLDEMTSRSPIQPTFRKLDYRVYSWLTKTLHWFINSTLNLLVQAQRIIIYLVYNHFFFLWSNITHRHLKFYTAELAIFYHEDFLCYLQQTSPLLHPKPVPLLCIPTYPRVASEVYDSQVCTDMSLHDYIRLAGK